MADRKSGFLSNANKDLLRADLDKDLIRKWRATVGRPLEYLGLPGSEMLDIVEWQEFLGCFTTVERLKDQQHLLFLRANVHDVEHRLHALHGEFDTILLTGRDTYGRAPKWPYDLVNLDFYGGLLYSDLSRPRAVRKLIENQAAFRRSFLLLVTHDLRDSDKSKEKALFLDNLRKSLRRDYGIGQVNEDALDWYQVPSTPDSARQGLYANVFLHDTGENAQFKVWCRRPIIYTGTGGTKMIHFATDFVYSSGMHRATSDQSLLEVCNLGVSEVLNGSEIQSAYMVPRITASS